MDFDGIAQMVKNTEKTGRKLESRPPPFLTKTYEMVDKQETNSYITWNSTGTGFIILDHNKFSAHVLPMFFKTANFSSFVYQLNNYGFKKISWERYEYGNQWFQAGKKHWLKNIKRRNQVSEWSRSHQPGRKRARSTDPDQTSINGVTLMETKLDALINEQNEMQLDIQMLKQSFDNMEDQLVSLEIPKFPDLKDDDEMYNAFFLKQFMDYMKKKKGVEASDDYNVKRPRLDAEGAGHEPAENTENYQFWKKILEEEDSGFVSNEGCHGDVSALHSKAMMELDEMMATDIAMQKESMIEKLVIDLDGEDDDGHFELWT